MGQVRTRTVHGSVAALAAVVLVMLAACTPPVTPPPAPTLPTGTGVAWWKDAGGTIVEDFGGPTYRPAFQRWVTLGGTATGPGPVDAGAALPAPYLAAFGFNLPMYPDGTAKYPWNGFAGEGISAATNPNSIVVAFPGGTCTIGASLGVQVGGITPSPDGTKLAYVGRDISGFFGYTVAWVDILSLHPGGGCSAVTSWTVDYSPEQPADHPNTGLVVWSPESDSILFPVSTDGGLWQRIVRLDAVAGATPQTILDRSARCWFPLGWSVDDRVLLSCVEQHAGNPMTVRSTLETMPVAGGPRTVIDAAESSAVTSSTANMHLYHYGYFVPGTSTIVYNDGSEAFPTSKGTVPAFRLRLHDDLTGAEAPLPGAPSTTTTHPEPLLSDPQATTPIPDLVLVERFVR